MIATINYHATISWTVLRTGKYYDRILCAVEHKIDTDNLKTVSIRWTSVDKDYPGLEGPL